jgi:glycosyltransferase involved in cell wall biosynthesis
LIAKLFRIKKIVFDYRDEWEDYYISGTNSRIFKRYCEFLKSFMTKCYLRSDLVVTVTEPFVYSLSLRGVKNVKIVANGADISVFRPYNKELSRKKIGCNEHDFIFIYNGAIGGYYRLDTVVLALKNLIAKAPNSKLVVVGEGPSLKSLFTLSKKANVQNNFIYLGAKSDMTELAGILSAADVGIIPYNANPLWKNSLPVKSFEYFACGVPVIATAYKDSILAKLIDKHRIGLISDPEDVHALADAMEKMYLDYNFLKEASIRAVKIIEEHYDRNKSARNFLSLLSVKQ